MGQLVDYIPLIVGLINLLINAWLLLNRRNDKTEAHVNALRSHVDSRLDRHSERLSTHDAVIRGLPTHEHLGDLHEKVNGVSGALSKIDGELGVIRRLSEDMNRYLRENK